MSNAKRPFIRTHTRLKDGLPAMHLAELDGLTLYRVEWSDNGKRHENTLVRPATAFCETFRVEP